MPKEGKIFHLLSFCILVHVSPRAFAKWSSTDIDSLASACWVIITCFCCCGGRAGDWCGCGIGSGCSCVCAGTIGTWIGIGVVCIGSWFSCCCIFNIAWWCWWIWCFLWCLSMFWCWAFKAAAAACCCWMSNCCCCSSNIRCFCSCSNCFFRNMRS